MKDSDLIFAIHGDAMTFDFYCNDCRKQFQSLIKPREPYQCPWCRSTDCIQMIPYPELIKTPPREKQH